MKQYTTTEQTAKLIELGFAKPRSEYKAEQAGDCAWHNPAYSLDELWEKLHSYALPMEIEAENYANFGVTLSVRAWVDGTMCKVYRGEGEELIDLLVEALAKLVVDNIIPPK